MNYPSIKTLMPVCTQADNQESAAKIARGIIDGRIDPTTFQSVQSWIKQCWHMPSKHELKMCALNELLRAHGVEAIHTRKGIAEYLNFGDTYDTTIVYYAGRYTVTSFGDWIESQERQHNRTL